MRRRSRGSADIPPACARIAAGCGALVLPLCWCGHGQAAAPASLNLTLVEAVHMALRNNRGLLGSRLDRVVQRLSLREAEDRFRPHVTVGPYVKSARDVPGEAGCRPQSRCGSPQVARSR